MEGKVGVAPGTTTIQVNGLTFAFGNWIDDKYYGSGQFANAQTDALEVFVVERGGTIPGGTRRTNKHDTNLPRSGSVGLPQDWEMYVFGLSISITRVMRANNSGAVVFADGTGALSNPPTLATWFAFDRVTYFKYQYNQTMWTEGVPQNYPQGHGYGVFSTNTGFELSQNGIASPRDRVAWVLPIWERMGLGYVATFQPEAAIVISQPASDEGTALTFIDVKVEKNGLIKKNVVGA